MISGRKLNPIRRTLAALALVGAAAGCTMGPDPGPRTVAPFRKEYWSQAEKRTLVLNGKLLSADEQFRTDYILGVARKAGAVPITTLQEYNAFIETTRKKELIGIVFAGSQADTEFYKESDAFIAYKNQKVAKAVLVDTTPDERLMEYFDRVKWGRKEHHVRLIISGEERGTVAMRDLDAAVELHSRQVNK